MSKLTPLMPEELTQTQRVSLAALKQHPGYQALELLLMAACKRASEEVIKLDPVEEGYERKLKALQMRARERNEFSLLILMSIDWQIKAGEVAEALEKKDEPEINRIVKKLNTISKGQSQ